jgi:hypothetical protein
MAGPELRKRLQQVPVPDEAAAEARAWELVHAAFTEREPVRRRPPVARLRPVLALATIALTLGVAAVTPPGEAVAEWVRDVLQPGRRDARPALVRLPAPGRLLVTSEQGAWVVAGDGSRRRLGAYEQATWSPRGLYVAVTRGRELTAVEPNGRVRWSLARSAPIADARWAPSGYRIAYRSGRSLRVVAGDGTGDRLLRRRVAPVAPAWRPGRAHVLAFATAGRVVVTDERRAWRSWSVRVGGPVAQLDWTPGDRLVVRTRDGVRVYGGRGRQIAQAAVPGAGPVLAAALAPDGRTLAVARRQGSTGVVLVRRLAAGAPARTLFRGRGAFSDLAWSPDGRWLLIAWRDADQWLFVRSAQVRRISAVSRISRAFAPGRHDPQPFPRVGAWCCPPGR